MTGPVMAALRRAGKIAAGVVPAALAARLGLPALGAAVFLAVLVIGTAWWVFRSDARTERVSRVLLAWRGNPGCLPPPRPHPGRRRGSRAAGAGRGAHDRPVSP